MSRIEGNWKYERHLLNYTILRSICFSSVKSLFLQTYILRNKFKRIKNVSQGPIVLLILESQRKNSFKHDIDKRMLIFKHESDLNDRPQNIISC